MRQDAQSSNRGIIFLNRICVFGGIVSLLGMAIIIVANVIGRYFFQSPLVATVELVGIAGAFLVSLSLLPCEFARRNVSVPVITSKLPPRPLKVFNFSNYALSLIIVGVYILTGAALAWEMMIKREKTTVLALPVPLFRLVWVVGCILLFVILFIHMIETTRGKKQWNR